MAKLKYIIPSILVLALSLFIFPSVKANVSYFIRQNNGIGSTATTSIVYMTAGTATTTYYFDSGVGTVGSTDSAILAAQFTASSTASLIHIDTEYAQGGYGLDCIATPSSCDWYQSNLSNQATTSPIQNISVEQDFTWQFASSTQGFGAIGTTTNRALKVVTIPTPTRYVRAVFTMPTGSFNGAVWAEFVAKRQAN